MLPADMRIAASDLTFLRDQISALTDERIRLKVSEWAAEKRYLPSELTTKPGKWDNSYTPYLVEIMDCLSANHPARKVVFMKGAQIGATTGVLENFIGYTIDHDPSSMVYVSADKELTKMGMEIKVDRMLQHSKLTHLLKAPGSNTKRSGDTSTMKEFPNGYLMAVGARNPGKLRSMAFKKAVLDELDGMPLMLGQIGQEEGSPDALIEKRTDSYQSTRKILYISTPLKLQTSLIHPLFLAGDQRHYYIPCRHCGHMQHLEWHGITPGGKVYGIMFDTDDNGNLVVKSVRYQCINCDKQFYNHDKSWFLPRGKWIAHSTPDEEGLVSFHLNAFYSPPGTYAWSGSVYKWMKAWDVKQDRMRSVEKLQAFYNLERGLPWEERGESPKFERVVQHRRAIYSSGEIPNKAALEETGAPVVLLTCAVDVHKDRLDVEVLAWCQDMQTYHVEWLHLEGTSGRGTDDMGGTGPWAQLAELIEHKTYIADDGRIYVIRATLIDVGWAEKMEAVYSFCQRYSTGVYPVMGREVPIRGSLVKEFNQSESATGNVFYNVTATIYKNRMASWLKADWEGGVLQPTGYPNYPQDRADDFFRQYEAEHKVRVIDPRTKAMKGWRWELIGQRENHAWDCRVYNMAAFDMIVLSFCQDTLKLDKLDYSQFFNYATPKQNEAGQWLPNRYSYHPEQIQLVSGA